MSSADEKLARTDTDISEVATPAKVSLSGGREGASWASNQPENEGTRMLPDRVIRKVSALGKRSRSGKPVKDLFRLMGEPTLWMQAYINLAPNQGATTKGVDATTLDGFSMSRVENLIAQLKMGLYCPKPVRRVYIPKANGKQRPLGLPSGDDKLVQEMVRMILEAIYEPIFRDESHGFRPGRSCHTALHQLRRTWKGVKWVINVDIQDFFNAIDHDILINLLKKRIDDKRFIKLILSLLKAGVCENWIFQRTYSGTPQGGICSPILANVYLHELDIYMQKIKGEVDKGKRRKPNGEYKRYSEKIAKRRKQMDELDGHEPSHVPRTESIKREIKALQTVRDCLPSVDFFDPGYRRLRYCRYADDFVIGLIGSKAEALDIMHQLQSFLYQTLRLNVSETKSRVLYIKEGFTYLGYTVKGYSGDRRIKTKRAGRYTIMRSNHDVINLKIPESKIRAFCQKHSYGNYATHRAWPKNAWLRRSDTEIILAYNAQLRGFANYYSLADNVKRELSRLSHLQQLSLLKTLAGKHQTSVSKTYKRLRLKQGLGIRYQVRGQWRTTKIFRLSDLKRSPNSFNVDRIPNIYPFTMNRSELVQRLNANKCEYCGREEGYFEVHHIRRLRDTQGKELWQRVMAAMRRKTLILCVACHDQLHTGTLPPRKVA